MPDPVSDSITDKWVDIVSPLAPAHAMGPLSVAVIAIVFTVLLGVAFVLYRRPQFRAKRVLRELTRKLHQSQLDSKAVCIQVRECLRSGLGQRQLQFVQWSDGSSTDWLAYLDRLAEYSFAAPSPSSDELDKIINEAGVWLNRKTVTS